jgi:hypothetical protein
VSAAVEAEFPGLHFVVGLHQGIHLPANKFHVFRKVFDKTTETAVDQAATQWKSMVQTAHAAHQPLPLGLIPVDPLVGIAWDYLLSGPTKQTFKSLVDRVSVRGGFTINLLSRNLLYF